MGGLFGVVSEKNCVEDLFYGTDYHSHLGTKYGGLAVINHEKIDRHIHDISNAQFRSKFQDDIGSTHGKSGIGIISDYEPQPLTFHSHLGDYAIATVGLIKNLDEIVASAKRRKVQFSEMSSGEINPTELVAALIAEGNSFEEGIENAQITIKGSCSMLVLTKDGIYAARDRLGRTPIIIGKKQRGYAAASETCSFPNLGYEIERYLGPGEIALITEEGIEDKKAPEDKMLPAETALLCARL